MDLSLDTIADLLVAVGYIVEGKPAEAVKRLSFITMVALRMLDDNKPSVSNKEGLKRCVNQYTEWIGAILKGKGEGVVLDICWMIRCRVEKDGGKT